MANLILWNSLVRDPVPVRPTGPHQLASWLQSHGYTVKVIDFCNSLSTSQLFDITQKYIDSTTISIGVSTTFWKDAKNRNSLYDGFLEPKWVQEARNAVQSKFPNLKWILGGGSNYNANLKFDWQIFKGHAEDELLKYMDEKSAVSMVKRMSRRAFDIKNLQSCYKDDLGIQSQEVLPIELGRGCQFKCKFCSYPLLGKKKNTYLRDFSLIERELMENYQKYGTTRYFFVDDTVNESEEKIVAMAEIAQRLPFKLEWVGYNRLDLIGSKPHTIDLLKESGLKSSHFGIESFHPGGSKLVGKGWNGVHGKNFLLELKEKWKNDINFTLGFIVGLTGENEASIDETHQWCIDNDMPYWEFYPLSINKNPDFIWTKSEFDLNYDKYGYSFPDEKENTYWVNDFWNRDTAIKKVIDIMPLGDIYRKLSGWHMGEIASLGYSFDELINTYRKDLNYNELLSERNQFLEKYVDSQLKL